MKKRMPAAIERQIMTEAERDLLKRDMISFIASDAHSDGHRRVDFSAAKSFINKKFPKYAAALFGSQNVLGI